MTAVDMRPPTDDMYKFLSIFGLAITLAAGYAAFQIWSKSHQLDLNSKTLRGLYVETNLILGAVQLVGALVDGVNEVESGAPQNLEEEIIKKITSDEIFKLIPTEREVLMAELEAELTWEQNREVFCYLVGVIAIGVGISVFGSTLWYVKVQRKVDMLLEVKYRDAIHSMQCPLESDKDQGTNRGNLGLANKQIH